jgi:hypothetical protein
MGISVAGRRAENRSRYSPGAPKGVKQVPICRLPPDRRKTHKTTVTLFDAIAVSRLAELRGAKRS